MLRADLSLKCSLHQTGAAGGIRETDAPTSSATVPPLTAADHVAPGESTVRYTVGGHVFEEQKLGADEVIALGENAIHLTEDDMHFLFGPHARENSIADDDAAAKTSLPDGSGTPPRSPTAPCQARPPQAKSAILAWAPPTEQITEVEFCVFPRRVTEVWEGWPGALVRRNPLLFSPKPDTGELPRAQHYRSAAEPFLFVYSSGHARRLAPTVRVLLSYVVMRAMRYRLACLLAGDRPVPLTISQWCRVDCSRQTCEVTWCAELVVVVAQCANDETLSVPRVLKETGALNPAVSDEREDMDTRHTNVLGRPPHPFGDALAAEVNANEEPSGSCSGDFETFLGEHPALPVSTLETRNHFKSQPFGATDLTAVSTSTCFSPMSLPVLFLPLPAAGSSFFVRHLMKTGSVLRPSQHHFCVEVRLEKVCLVQQSVYDEQQTLELADRLYRDFVQPAEWQRSGGNETLQHYQKTQRDSRGDGTSPPRSGNVGIVKGADDLLPSEDSLASALQEYVVSIRYAQRGALFPFQHQLPVPYALEETTVSEAERESCEQAYRTLQRVLYVPDGQVSTSAMDSTVRMDGISTGNASVATECMRHRRRLEHLYAPLHAPGVVYFNEALLRVQLSDSTVAGALRLCRILSQDPVLDPARAAMAWRERPAQLQTNRSIENEVPHCKEEWEFRPFTFPPPTELQYVWYTVHRLLVTSTCNAALAVLCTYERPDRPVGRLEVWARACAKAGAVVLRLLQWHCPHWVTRGCILSLSPAASAELFWCLQMYCKLRVRESRLWGLAGVEDNQGRAIWELEDTLRRWSNTRAASQKSSGGALAEDLEEAVVALAEEQWTTLLTTVTASIKEARQRLHGR